MKIGHGSEPWEARFNDELPRIYLCMLNWNGRHHLGYAIPSVCATSYPNYELVLVDNASTDDSVQYIQRAYPKLRVIRNERNLHWAGGNNVGIRDALERGFDWVVLINNDILVDPRWLGEAVRAAEWDVNIGLIGFNVIGEFKKTPRDAFYAAREAYSRLEVHDTMVISGCALMVRADVFANIGLIDEVFEAYGEEDDFEKRAYEAGYRLVRINTPIWHYSEGTNKILMPLRSAYMSQRNLLRIIIKYRGYRFFIRSVFSLYKQVLLQFPGFDSENALHRRMRPSSSFVNFWIATAAIIWNILHYAETRHIRREEQLRIEAANKRRSHSANRETE